MKRRFSHLAIMSLLMFASLALIDVARASTEKVLYSFTGIAGDGAAPGAALVFDNAGNLYGTTGQGGSGIGYGTVFELIHNADGTWSEKLLYTFSGGADGNAPGGALVFDGAGNLYGTTGFGGTAQMGNVFELIPNADGTWTETTLYSFTGPDGKTPIGGLIFDAAGNMYGTTTGGGPESGGTVFELTRNLDGTWSENLLLSFPSENSARAYPYGLVFDSAGNLYGAAAYSGQFGNVFKLSPTSTGGWRAINLHTFGAPPDGEYPQSPVILDTAGNIYGTTPYGGASNCSCGTVFRLKSTNGGNYAEKILHSFSDTPGKNPFAGLVLDNANNLYGATIFNNAISEGTVFRISLSTGAFTTLHIFNEPGDGNYPLGTPILDSSGNLYGTTDMGGAYGLGAVYEITP